jgi:tetratricopeptide (TPR) repeat protein
MPQDGETPLARLAQAIARGDGLSIGTPTLRKDGVTAIVPILRTRKRDREYVLATEVPDELSAIDPGRIDRLRVRNGHQLRVFLPPGTLFEGTQTPSRGTTAGVFLDPRSEADIEVKCVHASQGLSPRAVLHLAPHTAPDHVRQALISRDQGLVWATVRDEVGVHGASETSDDLLGALAGPGRISRGSSERLTGTPLDEDQCGAALLDGQGVVAVELFDSPESWRIACRADSNGDLPRLQTTQPSPLVVTLEPERTLRAAKEFFVELVQAGYRRVAANGWTALDGSSAYTTLNGELVHLVAFGRGESRARRSSVASDGHPEGASSAAGFNEGVANLPLAMETPFAGDGEAAVAEATAVDLEDSSEPDEPTSRPMRRKVLTSGWDTSTFESLERYTRKEFGGDRSAAMRFLVRQGLGRRGYLGPRPPRPIPGVPPSAEPEDTAPRGEIRRAALESRIRDYERIAQTDVYAEWLRKRARLELERMASAEEDRLLRAVVRSALKRLPSLASRPDASPPVEEAPPGPLSVDVRPLLRRAFSASAGGRYPDALALFDEVLDAEPDNRTALLGRAVAFRRSGKAPEALAALDLVLGLEPANAAALLNRGRVLQERGDLRGALETFDRLAAVAPNDWDVWMARGDVLARMGQDREALGAYSEALRRNPDDENLNAKIRALERIRLEPPPAPLPRVALPRNVQEGQTYLVKEGRADLSYRIFRSLAGRKIPSLLVTHQPPDQVRAEQGLQDIPILELSHAPGVDRVTPTSLAILTKTIERFVADHRGHVAILLDGIGPLVANNGFRDTALFIERVNETILQSHAIFLISVTPGDLGEKESALLERDLRVLS